MKVYIAHSREFDFQNELYAPLRAGAFNTEHTFILPHEKEREPFSSIELFQNGCDLVIAEVSFPSTGLGIELGWADMLKVPIVCINKMGTKPSGSLKAVCNSFVEYADTDDLLVKIESIVAAQKKV